MKLMAVVYSVRLARRVKESLKMSIGRVWYFTDSSAVLGRLTTDSGLLNEFMGAIGSEVSSTVVWTKYT
jgi:hypothetical protein